MARGSVGTRQRQHYLALDGALHRLPYLKCRMGMDERTCFAVCYIVCGISMHMSTHLRLYTLQKNSLDLFTHHARTCADNGLRLCTRLYSVAVIALYSYGPL